MNKTKNTHNTSQYSEPCQIPDYKHGDMLQTAGSTGKRGFHVQKISSQYVNHSQSLANEKRYVFCLWDNGKF